jgi:2-polyprenyl-3-methyl-5-hydroxy-6-metoxy-1,4-benzoquinol methylase
MAIDVQLERRFDREAARFDAIYSGQAGIFARMWDGISRRNVHWRFQFALDVVQPIEGRHVLDVGCGSGRFSVALAKAGAAKVVGLDLSRNMLEIAGRLAEGQGVQDRCDFIQTDALTFTTDRAFDVALAIGFFDYLREPLPMLRHIAKLTTGTIVASFPARWSFRAPARKLWRYWQGCHVEYYSRGDIERLCVDAGCRPRTIVRHGPIYMLVAESPATIRSEGTTT